MEHQKRIQLLCKKHLNSQTWQSTWFSHCTLHAWWNTRSIYLLIAPFCLKYAFYSNTHSISVKTCWAFCSVRGGIIIRRNQSCDNHRALWKTHVSMTMDNLKLFLKPTCSFFMYKNHDTHRLSQENHHHHHHKNLNPPGFTLGKAPPPSHGLLPYTNISLF
jgi:hypothetical protein